MFSELPESVELIAVLIVAVLPGACFVWGAQLVRRRYQETFVLDDLRLSPQERVLALLLAAVGYHLLLGPVEYLVWRRYLEGATTVRPFVFGVIWAGMLAAVVLPGLAGWLFARYTEPRPARDDAWRRALDVQLAGEYSGFLVVTLVDGSAVAGRFSERSSVGLGERRDVYLEEQHRLEPDGTIGSGLGYALFVPAASILTVALVEGAPPVEEE